MTMLTDRFTNALDYARVAHAKQARKGSDVTYLSHLLAVSSLLLKHGGNETQAIAGLLHDVIEDCGAGHEAIIREKFGDTVADIVVACTDGTAESKTEHTTPESKRRDWWIRKLTYLEKLGSKPDAILLVSGCDKLDNAQAIVADLENASVGQAVFDRFKGGKDGTLRYYHSLAKLMTKRNVSVAQPLQTAVARMHELAGGAEHMDLDHGVYRLKIYDNFHYMDEDETYTTGWFFSADEAIDEAKRRVLEDLGAGPSAEEKFSYYTSFGEDPSIIGTPEVTFSAWTFAKEAAARLNEGVTGDGSK